MNAEDSGAGTPWSSAFDSPTSHFSPVSFIFLVNCDDMIVLIKIS